MRRGGKIPSTWFLWGGWVALLTLPFVGAASAVQIALAVGLGGSPSMRPAGCRSIRSHPESGKPRPPDGPSLGVTRRSFWGRDFWPC